MPGGEVELNIWGFGCATLEGEGWIRLQLHTVNELYPPCVLVQKKKIFLNEMVSEL